ncbi:MAG: hypothetical protein D6790_19345 [Caldilineae bacterium]|nr:MAG: hypothetical protein D6790_19345 [Caldilineae bacterium]
MVSPIHEKCPPPLRQQIEEAPDNSFDLILRVSEVDDAVQAEIERAGFQVRRRLTLVPQFAVSGPGQALFNLLEYPWLLSVEEDGSVHTC